MIDDNGLIMYKEWKKVFILVNIEPLRLVIVTPKKDLGRHGMRGPTHYTFGD